MMIPEMICNYLKKLLLKLKFHIKKATKAIHTFTTTSTFLQISIKQCKCPLLKVSFSFMPDAKKVIISEVIQSTARTAQAAKATSIFDFTSSLPEKSI